MRGTEGRLEARLVTTRVAYKRDLIAALGAWGPEPPEGTITGTAGTPGSWSGADGDPDSCAQVQATVPTPTASPATAWTEGQYVPTDDAVGVHWDGSAWQCGPVPGEGMLWL